MTIYLHEGSITDANPSNAFSDVFKTLVGGTDVTNWSFVENIPAGTGEGKTGSASYSCDVFKCAGSGDDANDAGIDWYIGILRYGATVSSGLQILLAEEYNATTKKFSKYTSYRAGSYSSSAAAGTDENGYVTFDDQYSSAEAAVNQMVSGNYASRYTSTINTTGFSYWIYLTKNLVIFATKVGATEKSCYLGLMDSLIASSTITDPLPLVLVGNGLSNYQADTGGVPTRLPGVLSIPHNTYSRLGKTPCYPWTAASATSVNVTNNAGYQDLWNGGGIYVSRILIAHTPNSASFTHLLGHTRGLLKTEVLCIPIGGTVNLGDTMTIGTETWTVVCTSAYGILHFIVRSA